MSLDWIWVFEGDGSTGCQALFTDKEKAEEYIAQYSLSGLLQKTPVNKSIYDWVVEQGWFTPKKEHHKTSTFVQTFTSAYLEHYHYEDGHAW
jgi:hypothetical protein